MFSIANDGYYVNRALSAFFKKRLGSGIPSEDYSRVEKIEELFYVVLRDSNQNVLAVYRINNNGILRRLKWYPKILI
jgi:hypothetical protein